jgi:membrane protein implicated in regulation of membrane protease activity
VDLFTATIIAVAVAGGIYGAIEFREIWSANRDGPTKPVSGLESALGTSALVSKGFTKSGTGALVGRIEFDGEDWRAEYVGTLPMPPDVGQPVKICGIDAGGLTVKVE